MHTSITPYYLRIQQVQVAPPGHHRETIHILYNVSSTSHSGVHSSSLQPSPEGELSSVCSRHCLWTACPTSTAVWSRPADRGGGGEGAVQVPDQDHPLTLLGQGCQVREPNSFLGKLIHTYLHSIITQPIATDSRTFQQCRPLSTVYKTLLIDCFCDMYMLIKI